MIIRAKRITCIGPDLYLIDPYARVLSNDEQKMIADLFPHTKDDVEELLDRETLLGSVVSEGTANHIIKTHQDETGTACTIREIVEHKKNHK